MELWVEADHRADGPHWNALDRMMEASEACAKSLDGWEITDETGDWYFEAVRVLGEMGLRKLWRAEHKLRDLHA